MTHEQPEGTGPTFNIQLPPEAEAGHYADFASIWHTTETFVLDFAAITRPAHPGEDAAGNPAVLVDGKVVTRVRVPASQVWEIMRALETQLSAWESETGRKPGRPQA